MCVLSLLYSRRYYVYSRYGRTVVPEVNEMKILTANLVVATVISERFQKLLLECTAV
jgi:hypothetical protein